jgi:hypothetical protein
MTWEPGRAFISLMFNLITHLYSAIKGITDTQVYFKACTLYVLVFIYYSKSHDIKHYLR